MRDHRSHRGITLIELLVAITILAVLIAIAVPTYKRSRELARASACAGNLRSLGVALNLYLSDHNSTFPTLEIGRTSIDDDVPVIDNTLNDYTETQDIFRCPADNSENFFTTTGSSYFWNHLLNGQRLTNANFLGLIRSPKGIPAISDKENFHKWRGHEVNILYVDGHVDKELKFNVEL